MQTNFWGRTFSPLKSALIAAPNQIFEAGFAYVMSLFTDETEHNFGCLDEPTTLHKVRQELGAPWTTHIQGVWLQFMVRIISSIPLNICIMPIK